MNDDELYEQLRQRTEAHLNSSNKPDPIEVTMSERYITVGDRVVMADDGNETVPQLTLGRIVATEDETPNNSILIHFDNGVIVQLANVTNNRIVALMGSKIIPCTEDGKYFNLLDYKLF